MASAEAIVVSTTNEKHPPAYTDTQRFDGNLQPQLLFNRN